MVEKVASASSLCQCNFRYLLFTFKPIITDIIEQMTAKGVCAQKCWRLVVTCECHLRLSYTRSILIWGDFFAVVNMYVYTIICTVCVNPRHVRAGCHNSSMALKAVALLLAATGIKGNYCSLVEESVLDSSWNVDIRVYSLYLNFIPKSSTLALSFLSFNSSTLPLNLILL